MDFPAIFAVSALVAACLGLCGAVVVLTLRNRTLAKFRTVAENAQAGLLIQGHDSRILWTNRAYRAMTGYAAHELKGRYPLEFLLPPQDRPGPTESRSFGIDPSAPDFGSPMQIVNRRKSGEDYVVELVQSIVAGSEASRPEDLRIVTVCRDVSDRVQRETELQEARDALMRSATTDTLTGLANRRAIQAKLTDRMGAGVPVAVLHVDLDGFKRINDTYGHDAGDAVLRHAGRVLAEMPGGGMAGRLGGDEFLLVLPNITDLHTLLEVGQALRDRLVRPVSWDFATLRCDASVGGAVSLLGAADGAELVTQADVALYAAKRKGKARVEVYDEALHRQHMNAVTFRRDAARAVRDGKVEFHLQPIIDLHRAHVSGGEVLLRWTHPEHGSVSPARLLPVIEELGLQEELDKRAIEACCAFLALARDRGLELRCGVNASPGALQGPEFCEYLMWQADLARVERRCIVVEVHETTVLNGSREGATASEQIRRLRESGFRIALGDFGIGFAGVSHLAGLKLDVVKIDRSLLSRIERSPNEQLILSALLQIAHGLDLDVVTEGVENRSQIAVLRGLGARFVQGYAFSRPVAFKDALDWIEAVNSGRLPLQSPMGTLPVEPARLPAAS